MYVLYNSGQLIEKMHPGPVSYTHLDVYKRQMVETLKRHFQNMTSSNSASKHDKVGAK